MSQKNTQLDTIVALCKRRGFVYPSGEIYGGINGLYDFGPLGTLLKENIQNRWKKSLIQTNHEICFLDGSILGAVDMWKASGHVDNFSDPMVDCLTCKKRYRADELDLKRPCPHCGNSTWTAVRQFNMMFQTQLGAAHDQASIVLLRPETAQTVFINFKNVMASTRIKIPFGIAQIGKAFRNEITPKQFLFRVREFEQMELEWFCKPADAAYFFDQWSQLRFSFYTDIGIRSENIRMRAHAADELAHYSTQCSDVEYQFSFGWKELEGIAYRGNFDLSQHTTYSGKDLGVYDEQAKGSYIPHVVECSVGVGRLFFALLCDAYYEDMVDNEPRVVLKLHPHIAPIKAAILPLTKVLQEPAHKLYTDLKKESISLQFDETGSIGKRYRRQDEIGTPFCITYDFESAVHNSVTVRHRDSMEQIRISIDHIATYLKKELEINIK